MGVLRRVGAWRWRTSSGSKMGAKGESRSLHQLHGLFLSSRQPTAIGQWLNLGPINAKYRTRKEFPIIIRQENQLIPKMPAYKSIETRQTWVSDVILCLWSLWWPIDPTSTFCFKEFVWKRVELQRANSFHYLARLWSKHGASRIRRDSCWKAELPRIGNGWWPKWNRNRAYQKCCIERWMGMFEKSTSGHLLASKPWERNQNAQSRQEVQVMAD